jgi:23S rRNA (cytosine1962-C5)-methyltransferase
MELRGQILLKPGRDGPVHGGNPWVFSQAIARIEPVGLAAGDGVEVRAANGQVLGYGYYNPRTTIAVRLLAFDFTVAPTAIVRHRLEQAIAFRKRIILPETNCYRLINGDGDGLSGVLIDRYDDVLVIQLLTEGADRMRAELLGHLSDLFGPRAIYERSAGAVRRQEGLDDRTGLVSGNAVEEVLVSENGVHLMVDLEHGQKTGYFLDQRENRRRVMGLARGARVLDAYCYAGGYGLAALAGGAAEITAIDTSAAALASARRNFELNQHDASRYSLIQAEVPQYLATSGRKFDIVVIDPPPFARSAKDSARAGRLYVEINRLAMEAVAPAGSLLTFSCSAHFIGADFARAVHLAQTRARRDFRLVERLGPGPDHPIRLGHAEGEYLTGLWLTDLGCGIRV